MFETQVIDFYAQDIVKRASQMGVAYIARMLQARLESGRVAGGELASKLRQAVVFHTGIDELKGIDIPSKIQARGSCDLFVENSIPEPKVYQKKYEPEHNNIVWKIGRFTGQSEFVLSAEAQLSSMTNLKSWSRLLLSLSFSLQMFTSSGLIVRCLKVFEKSGCSSVRGARYMTRAGSYEIRYVCGLFFFFGPG